MAQCALCLDVCWASWQETTLLHMAAAETYSPEATIGGAGGNNPYSRGGDERCPQSVSGHQPVLTHPGCPGREPVSAMWDWAGMSSETRGESCGASHFTKPQTLEPGPSHHSRSQWTSWSVTAAPRSPGASPSTSGTRGSPPASSRPPSRAGCCARRPRLTSLFDSPSSQVTLVGATPSQTSTSSNVTKAVLAGPQVTTPTRSQATSDWLGTKYLSPPGSQLGETLRSGA